MKYSDLHDYQKYCVEWLGREGKDSNLSVLFLSCGLGKTIITLTFLESLIYDRFEVSRVLIVAPLRVTQTWIDEIKAWEHVSHLRYSKIVGSKAERLKALQADADVYIINRENLSWLVGEVDPHFFDMAVLDELSSFKSNSQRTKAFLKLRPYLSRVIGLTATPASNTLMDLYYEFRCIDMGERLYRFIGKFRNAFFKPDRVNGPIVYSYKLLPGAEEEIYKRISDITISMNSLDHLKMPELINNRAVVRMSEAEKLKYDTLKNDLVLPYKENDDITAANAAALSNKLVQLANGAVYTDSGEVAQIHSRKLDALSDLIEAQNGKPVVVVYWYKHDLQRIMEKLDNDGVSYLLLNSDENIEAFRAGKAQVALAHPASAGMGINIQKAADTMIWMSLSWSLELYTQMVQRLWRQGQQSGTVVVHHLVTEGSIDERILAALERKEKGQNALIEAVKAEL